MTGSVLTAASDTKRTLSISTCLQYIPFQATNYLEKKVPTLLQLDNSPPFRAVLSLHIFAFCSQESGDGSEVRAESQRSTTSLSVCLSVSGMDIYIYRSARLHFCLALHYHLTTEYIYMYTNTPVVTQVSSHSNISNAGTIYNYNN